MTRHKAREIERMLGLPEDTLIPALRRCLEALSAAGTAEEDSEPAWARPCADPETLTLSEAAELLRLNRKTIRRMADAGEFPPLVRVSTRKWIVSRAAVLEWIESRRVGAGDRSRALAAIANSVRPGLAFRRRRVARRHNQ